MFRQLLRRLAGPRLLNARFLFGAPLAYSPGHFYSPICNPLELEGRYRDPWSDARPASLPDIDLRYDAQLALWESWRPFLHESGAELGHDPARRYRLPSSSYDIGDATIYTCMLRHFRPRRLIEVGSGSSSAVAMDAFDRYFEAWPDCTFIEPYPALLMSLLHEGDAARIEIIPRGVQDVAPALFETLGEDDILFIDSTHIVKTGSDVVHELFEILPRLKPGVVVHFHDVFYPFEYPRDWVIGKNYSWNELYALRAFLMGNAGWEIVFFNDYFLRAEADRVMRDAPEVMRNPGGGLWLRKVGGDRP